MLFVPSKILEPFLELSGSGDLIAYFIVKLVLDLTLVFVICGIMFSTVSYLFQKERLFNAEQLIIFA